jgi:hypothetical protein
MRDRESEGSAAVTAARITPAARAMSSSRYAGARLIPNIEPVPVRVEPLEDVAAQRGCQPLGQLQSPRPPASAFWARTSAGRTKTVAEGNGRPGPHAQVELCLVLGDDRLGPVTQVPAKEQDDQQLWMLSIEESGYEIRHARVLTRISAEEATAGKPSEAPTHRRRTPGPSPQPDHRTPRSFSKVGAVPFLTRARRAGHIVAGDAGIAVVHSGVRVPRMNSIMERWVQSCRHELLDRTLIWNEHHLRHTLREFETHYNGHRPHQAMDQAAPLHALPEPITDPNRIAHLDVHRHDRLGGIIHEYQHAA